MRRLEFGGICSYGLVVYGVFIDGNYLAAVVRRVQVVKLEPVSARNKTGERHGQSKKNGGLYQACYIRE